MKASAQASPQQRRRRPSNVLRLPAFADFAPERIDVRVDSRKAPRGIVVILPWSAVRAFAQWPSPDSSMIEEDMAAVEPARKAVRDALARIGLGMLGNPHRGGVLTIQAAMQVQTAAADAEGRRRAAEEQLETIRARLQSPHDAVAQASRVLAATEAPAT